MTIGEVIQRVQSLYSKGVQSDDTRLSNRHIYSKLTTLRSKLLVQAANKRQKISQWNYTTLPCVELIKAPIHECPCLPPLGCTIYRTKYKLPEPLTNLNRHFIQSVTSLDGQTIYSEISWENYRYKASEKYTASKPDYFIRNDYLYITDRNDKIILTITLLLEDPLMGETFPSYCDGKEAVREDCQDPADCESFLDKEFKLDADMIDTLIEMSVNELIVLFNQNREDKTNDSGDNVTQESK